MSDQVRIDGLAEARKALGLISPELPKQLRRAFVPIVKAVADDARAHVPVKTGRARASIRSGVSGNYAYVAGGRSTVPYYGWLDFGGKRPHPRERLKRGRFLYPAIDRRHAETLNAALKAFAAVKREARLE